MDWVQKQRKPPLPDAVGGNRKSDTESDLSGKITGQVFLYRVDILLTRSYFFENIKRIGYTKSAEEYLKENKKFVVLKDGGEQVSLAAILLFGKNPQQFFPRAFIRLALSQPMVDF